MLHLLWYFIARFAHAYNKRDFLTPKRPTVAPRHVRRAASEIRLPSPREERALLPQVAQVVDARGVA